MREAYAQRGDADPAFVAQLAELELEATDLRPKGKASRRRMRSPHRRGPGERQNPPAEGGGVSRTIC